MWKGVPISLENGRCSQCPGAGTILPGEGKRMIEITDQVSIPEEELRFTASLSSGPGGQNVNKVSSRITLWFDVVNSPSPSQEQKDLSVRRIDSYIGKDGVFASSLSRPAARQKIVNWPSSILLNYCGIQ